MHTNYVKQLPSLLLYIDSTHFELVLNCNENKTKPYRAALSRYRGKRVYFKHVTSYENTDLFIDD